MVGRTFSASSSGTFTRTVSSFELLLFTRTCSHRSEVSAETFCGAGALSEEDLADDWAMPGIGRNSTAAKTDVLRTEELIRTTCERATIAASLESVSKSCRGRLRGGIRLAIRGRHRKSSRELRLFRRP